MNDLTEAQQSEAIDKLVASTGATKTGARAALQNADWDHSRAVKLLGERPWMAGMTNTNLVEVEATGAVRPTAFALGDRVCKTKGSEWVGRVVGTYSTELTPEGYCVESEAHPGSVQIYPVGALVRLAPR